jgi:hypothetical protein
MPKAKSKAQAGLFGAIAGGTKTMHGLSAAEAKKRLKGVKVSKLPKYSKSKKRG